MSSNVADLVRRAAGAYPDKPALISKNRRWTWAQLDRAVDAGAAALVGHGLLPGDRLLIQLPTSDTLAAALLAGARAGLTLVPIDPTRGDPERIAARVQAKVIVSDRPSDESATPGVTTLTSADLANWWTATDVIQVDAAAGGEDIAILGRASRSDKAVMLSHRALLAAVRMIGETTNLKLRPDDRVVLVLPLFHLAGFVTAFLPLTMVGGAAVIPDVPEVTGPNVTGTSAWRGYVDGVLTAIHDHHVTVIPGAPGLYRLLLRDSSLERSLASVRLLTSGASPLNPEDFSAMRSRTGSPVWEGYGISEAASVVTTSLMTAGARARSVGLPLAGVELKIESSPESDGAEDDLLADFDDDTDPGRICIRGDNLFSGYWPDGAGGPDEDGWFTTADVGYLDDSGELHLIDRASETITVAGFTVYPREVESALLSHPYVRDVAVVGLPGRAGQQLAAIIVANRGTTPTADDLTEHLAELLPPFKRPTLYHLTEILPRTELGRLDRDAVRADYAASAGLDLEVAAEQQTEPEAQRLTVVANQDHPVADAAAGGEEPPEQPVPEVMDVAQLDQLGSRLPGVQSRSKRSTYDTDDDLFGDDLVGAEPSSEEISADSQASETDPEAPSVTVGSSSDEPDRP